MIGGPVRQTDGAALARLMEAFVAQNDGQSLQELRWHGLQSHNTYPCRGVLRQERNYLSEACNPAEN